MDVEPIFKKIYTFKQFKNNFGARIVYYHDLNQFILMGGYEYPNYFSSIYLLNPLWIKTKHTLPKRMEGFGIIIVKQFIIIFGGMA